MNFFTRLPFSVSKNWLFAVSLAAAGPIFSQDMDLTFLENWPKEPGEIPVFYLNHGEIESIGSISEAGFKISAACGKSKTANHQSSIVNRQSSILTPPCTTCPFIEAILVDACGTEQNNEMLVINSGSGFNTTNLQVDWPPGVSNPNNDIHLGGTPCSLQIGNTAMVTGCANVNAVGLGADIPPNVLVVLQTSGAADFQYNLSPFCGGGQCVYLIRNTCTRTAGAFANNGSGLRTTTISLIGCPCTYSATYDRALVAAVNGAFYRPPGNTYAQTACPDALVSLGFPLPPVFTGPTTATVCAGTNYTLPAITGTNLTGNQKYFTGPNGTGTAYSAGDQITIAANTTLYIFDATMGCVIQLLFQITANPKPSLTVGTVPPICQGETIVSIPYTATTGSPNQFSISSVAPPIPGFVPIVNAPLPASPILVPIPANTPPGTYTFTGTVRNSTTGCVSDPGTATFTVNPLPAAAISASPATVVTCTNPTITLTASGGGTYLWSGGLGSSPVVTVSASGTYVVTVTAATGGCTASASQNITQNNTPPTAGITNNTGETQLDCNTPTISLTATGGGNYQWSNGLGTNPTVTIGSPATYSVTVTNPANGCTDAESIVISQDNTPPVVTITPSNSTLVLSCAVPTIDLTATSTPPAGATFSWTLPGGGAASGAVVTAAVSGIYSVTTTLPNGCTDAGNITLSGNSSLPDASVSPTTGTLTCATTTILLTANSTTGGATFLWPGGIVGDELTVSSSGTYVVTVTGPNGCTATASSVISQNVVVPGASVSPAAATISCTNPTATLTASSPASNPAFDWGNGNQTPVQIASTGGVFTVTVTGLNGCTSTASATITANQAAPTISILPVNPELNCTNSTVNLTASSNSNPPVLEWSTGQTTPTIAVSTAGNYSVTVTAGNGCTNATSVQVNQNLAQPDLSINPSSVALNCALPTAVLTASSTTNGTTFQWPGGVNSPNLTISAAGNYAVTATGPNGCTAVESASASADFLEPDAAVSPATAQLTCTSPTAILTASSTTNGATFLWPGGIAGSELTVSSSGTYVVTVTGLNGCTATASSVVSQNNSMPNGTLLPANPQLTCTNPSLMLTASSTTPGATFEWSTGANSSFIFVNSPGPYSVTITGPNGCTRLLSVNVSQAPEIASVAVSTTQTACGAATGSMSLTPIGGGPFTFDWGNQPGTGQNPRLNLPAGSFSVVVTNAFGCTAEAIGQVSAPGAPTVVTSSFPDTCGLMKGIGHLEISGGQPGYVIDWGSAPGSGSTHRTGLTVGDYVVTVTDAGGCTVLAGITIDELVAPTVQATTTPDFCGQQNGEVFLTITGDQPPFVIDWGPAPGNGLNPRTGLPAGVHWLTVTDAVACTQTISVNVVAINTVPTATINPPSATIDCMNPTATLVASTGTPGATFLWSNMDSGNTVVASAAGNFTVTVTAPNGCSNAATATVSGTSDAPTVDISPQNAALNCTSPTAILTANCPTPGATFSWGAGQSNPTLNVSSSGVYAVTVTVPGGCTATASAAVSQDFDVPDLTVAPPSGVLNCATASILITASSATPGVNFLWSNSESTASISVAASGSFSVTATAANGCTNAGGSNISADNDPPDLLISPTSGELNCAVLSIPLTAVSSTQNVVFEWSNGATTSSISVSQPGNFTVTATAPNACTAAATAIISQNINPPGLTLSPPGGNLTCAQPTLVLTASSPTTGATFLWENGSNSTTQTVNSPATFSVTVTAPNFCQDSATAVFGEIPPIQNIAAQATPTDCTGQNGSILLTITGGQAPFSIDWGAAPGSGSNPRTGLPPGNFTATATDANGCTMAAQAQVTAPQPPNLSVSTTAAGCTVANGTATLNIAGGLAPIVVNWGAAPGSGDIFRTGLPTGSFSVSISDGNNCLVSAPVPVGQTASPTASATATAASCGLENGSISISSSGGTGQLSINWGGQPGSGSNPRTGLPGGIFTATITDLNGCTASATASVLSPGAPVLAGVSLQNASCSLANGSVSLTISGGALPYFFDWGAAPGTGQNVRSNLPGGTWPVTVGDAAGCELPLVFQIQNSPPISDILAEPTNASCGGQNGTIEISLTGGTAPFFYNWGGSPGAGGQKRSGLPPGNFTVTVTDSKGCTATASAAISADPYVIGGQVAATPSKCGFSTGTASVTPISGIDVFQFQWGGQPGNGANPRINLPTGNYVVTISDGNGCQATASFTVGVIDLPVANAAETPADCGLENGQILWTVSGGTAPFSFNWGAQPGIGSNPRTGLPVGDYGVTVTDSKGCSTVEDGSILTDSIQVLTQFSPTTCGLANGQISLNASGGGPGGYQFDWGAAPGIGQNPRSNLPPGSFTVTVSQNAACTATATATIAASPAGPMISTTATATVCGQNAGSISVNLTGGTGPFSFNWGSQPGAGANPRTGLPAGNFVVTVSDSAGCTAESGAAVNAPGAPTVNFSATPTGCGTAVGTASLTIGGGVSPYNIDWGAAPGAGQNPRTGLPAGNFLVTVTGANACSATISIEIQGATTFLATASPTATTCGAANGSIFLTMTGGAGPFNFGWGAAAGAGQNPRSNLPSGNFTATISDASGCTATASATVAASTAIAVNATASPTACGQNSGQISLQISGGNAGGQGYFFNWGNTPGAGDNPRTSLPAGQFFATISDFDGCSAVISASVLNPGAPSVLVQNSSPAACGLPTGAVLLAISGGASPYNIDWGAAPGSGSNPRIGLPAGVFFATVSDANDCEATVGAEVLGTSASQLNLAATSCDPLAAGVDTVFLKNGAGCDSLVITTTVLKQVSQTFLAGQTCNLSLAGMDTILLKNAAGCDSLVISTTVFQPLAPTFLTKKTCNPLAVGLDSVVLKTLAGCDSLLITTTIFEANAADSTFLTAKTCDAAAAGLSQILLKNVAGCDSLVLTTTILQPSATTFLNEKTCNPLAAGVDTAFLQTVNGCDSLVILTTVFDAAFADSTFLTAKTCDSAAAGLSQILLKNAAGCDSLVLTTTILQPSATTFLNGKTCNPLAVGVDTAFLQTVNGCDSLVILTTVFDALAADSTFLTATTCDPLAVGFSQILLKNAAGCDSLVLTTTVLQPASQMNLAATSCDPAAVGIDTVFLQTVGDCDSLVITETTLDVAGCLPDFTAFLDPVNCHDEASGTIRIKPSQGLLPMTFSWLHIQSGATGGGPITDLTVYTTITGLIPGAYLVTVTSASGATVAKVLGVPNVDAISLTINVLSDFNGFAVRCAGSFDGQVEAVFSGGQLPVNFAWNGSLPGLSPTADALPAGPVSVILTDANGCTATASTPLAGPPPIEFSVSVLNEKCAGQANGRLEIGQPSGGVGPFLFSFEGGVFGSKTIFEPLAPGQFFLETEDANGCRDSLTATILPGAMGSFALPIDSATIFEGDTLRVPFGVAVGSILWSPVNWVGLDSAGQAAVFWPKSTRLYRATLTDSAGCPLVDELFIRVRHRRDFYVPNALFPGRGLNGNFTIFSGGGVVEIERLQVFDRWGEAVFSRSHFQPNDPSLGWDGFFKQEETGPGVFVWVAEIRLTNGELVVEKGDLTVVR